MLIRVEQEDIEGGERGLATACMVALAIRRATGAAKVVVGNSEIDVYQVWPWKSAIYWIPPEIHSRIVCFDLRWRVRPFEFELPARSGWATFVRDLPSPPGRLASFLSICRATITRFFKKEGECRRPQSIALLPAASALAA